MYLKKLLNKTLLVAAGMIMGATSAWGDTTLGAKNGSGQFANETSNWYLPANCTSAYLLRKGEQITFTFTVDESAGENDAQGYVGILAKTSVNTWGTNQYFFLRSDCIYAIGGEYAGGAICDENTYGTISKKDFFTGATVTMQMKRVGTAVIVNTKIIKEGTTHRNLYVQDLGTEDDAYAFLAADYSIITLKSAETTTYESPVTGTLIGKLNHTCRLSNKGAVQNFTIEPNGSLTLTFKNYTEEYADWAGWVFEAQYGDAYFTAPAGTKGHWGDLDESTTITSDANWPSEAELLEKMNGAQVELTITRSGATVNYTAVHTPLSGPSFTLTGSFTPTEENFATSNITVRAITELGHLDLLPVTKTITSAGWATYCSPYALNLAAAKGLTDAYIVTGGAAGVLTKTSVKDGTVPANTGLLLKGTEGSSVNVTIPIVGSSTTDVSANKLVGKTAAEEIAAETGWVLMGTPSLGFYQNKKAFTVGANTAYIPVASLPVPAGTGTAPAFFSLFDGETTGINTVKASEFTVNGEYYNLAGQRVAQPTKGLYIVNGKKVIVK